MHTLEQLCTGQLLGITRLDLSANLSEFPRQIFELADTLEILNLSGNQLNSLPDDLPRLHKLKVIFCSDNHFTELPAVLGQCAQLEMVGFRANQISHVPAAALPVQLRWLILTDNQLTQLPEQLGQATRLQKLMLAGNQLSELPATLANCHNLELVRIAANRFEALPECLLNLPKLAWLAFAGNPCADRVEAAMVAKYSVPMVSWNELRLGDMLGEGASGQIFAADWFEHGVQQGRRVAVKRFKSAVTSDGVPRCEMDACIAAGTHPNLIPVLAQIDDASKPALVLGLIDQDYQILAGPPSLASCTRDIFTPETQFTLHVILNILQGIASAILQTNAHGLIHGDVYAHNILYRVDGECLLGDLGAASFMPAEHRSALMAIEMRAFSCLLDDLLSRCSVAADHQQWLALRELQQQCGNAELRLRPDMPWVAAKLAQISARVIE
ncbi:serine/threonine-protein kinase [Chitinibacter fontanus]|uniref:Serine/threonine-protein kinase n=1 Tax=Chitinibacter fontanus TaxID=1737446 RepID=A0A7D5ZIE0_9NEIS|nr:leucine-rich repeat-containing protein kinase family protein [Chitinibacter fontanus]QLI82367.1 serine/threonine-protein kinase [Chitinibacter fontanus]